MKYLHVANLQLDPESPREEFFRLIEHCRKEEKDVLFITGNVFLEKPSEQVLAAFDEALSVLSKTRIFIVSGRNEAKGGQNPGIHYAFHSATTWFPENCIQRIFLARFQLEVTGVSYGEETWKRVRPEILSRGRKGALQILLLPFIGRDENEWPEANASLRTEFDYVAIGQGKALNGKEPARIYSPGSFTSADPEVPSLFTFIEGSAGFVGVKGAGV